MNKSTISPIPGIAGMIATLSKHFEPAKPKLPKRPKFKLPALPYDPLDPWKDTGTANDPDFVQLYITRDMKDIECVAEVTSCSHRGDEEEHSEECVEIGDCWDLHGNYRILTLEEIDEARQTWIKIQGRQAPYEGDVI